MKNKGISAILAVILMIMITIALGGIAFWFLRDIDTNLELSSIRKCKYFCVMKHMEYHHYSLRTDGISCECRECDQSQIIYGTNYSDCKLTEFILIEGY